MAGLASVKPYFRTAVETLGFLEHRDFANFNNIPGTELDQAYHLEMGTSTTVAIDQLVYTLQIPITVRLFRRGYNDTVETHENLMVDSDNLLGAVLLPATKLDGTLFNVVPGTVNYVQLSSDNDNWIVGVHTFTATIKICF